MKTVGADSALLYLAQREQGYVTEAAMKEIAGHLTADPAAGV